MLKKWKEYAPGLWWGDHLDVRFFLSSRLSELRNKKVLDLACGVGVILSEVNDTNYKVGIDISQKALMVAKKLNPNGNFVVGDICKLPFKDESFDTVYAAHVIPGADFGIPENKNIKNEQKNMVQEMNRILEKDGILLLTTPNANHKKYTEVKLNYGELHSLLEGYFDFEILGYNPLPISDYVLSKIPGIRYLLTLLMRIDFLKDRNKSFYVSAIKV